MSAMIKSRKDNTLSAEAIMAWDGGDAPGGTAEARDILDAEGYVVVTGLPQEPVAREGSSSVSQAFWDLARAIGRPQIYPGEGGAGAVMDLRPSRNVAAAEVSWKSCNEFGLHTDLSYIDNPPRYVGLFVVRPDRGKKADYWLSHVDDAVDGLSAAVRKTLSESRFHFLRPRRAGDGIADAFDEATRLPVLKEDDDGFHVRFRSDTVIALDQKAIAAFWDLSENLKAVKKSHFPEAGTAIFVDNRKILHARSAFTPTYDENDRHIQRVYLDI